MKVFYICDRKNKCYWSPICGTKEGCNHTSNPKHAKNGITEDPENDDRFIKTPQGDYFEALPGWNKDTFKEAN